MILSQQDWLIFVEIKLNNAIVYLVVGYKMIHNNALIF